MTTPLTVPPTTVDEPAVQERAGMAPATLQGLRELMFEIARGQSDIAIGAKALHALGRILDLKGDPALLSITTLADRLDIHPSTITRLARNLGYKSFGAFQEVLLSTSLSTSGSFYSRQAQSALDSSHLPSQGVATRLCRENQANIDRFVDAFDAASFDQAVSLITHAPRIAVHGIRQFHAFASFLVYGLRMIRSDVHLLDSNALGNAEALASLTKDDLLISASCSPYSRLVADTAAAAAEKGLTLLAITDGARSPLVEHSRTALFVPHDTSFLSNSLTTFILLAECLINACAAAMPDSAKQALAERDAMIKRLNIEL
ncbi:MurR/RpiR family transcriptional regulator [Pokkaliibacter sp. MBI-7]|uniref:MurR/RpiR family transcriptional regulator n=1 Tax=Pokkaliibacter sp. MBI-7 TaxID=3040600 RepID=UPI002446F981|nr:MurR/RpiR family transcriptional regulator [Pokkaliibacter sp. MBI-7]MDH2435548.1 MurR/RpiR family transcriptional regulator [Pokkaliibacter sp. MBI-7]